MFVSIVDRICDRGDVSLGEKVVGLGKGMWSGIARVLRVTKSLCALRHISEFNGSLKIRAAADSDS